MRDEIIAASGPNWLGSPQHVLGGVVVAVIAAGVLRPHVRGPAVRTVLAIGVACLAEVLVEIAEYPLLYSHTLHASAYYDTIADLASTLVGAVLGASAVLVIGISFGERSRRRG